MPTLTRFRLLDRLSMLILLYMCMCLIHNHQIEAAPTQSNLRKAQDLVQQGRQEFRKKNFLQGITFYQQAHRLFADPKNLYMIAQAYGSLSADYCPNTLEAWEDFFEMCETCKWKKKGDVKYQQQQQRCYTDVTLTSPVVGAAVWYQDQLWGKIPLRKRLAVGTYVIQITAEGYMPHSIRLVVEENKKTQTQPIHLIQQESNWVAENQTVLATGGSVISALFLSLSVWHYLSARDTADQATTLIQQVDTSLSPAKRPAFEQNIQRLESESDTAQSTSLIFLGTSVLFAAASTWLWTHDFKTQPTTKHTLQSRKKSRSRYSINALVDQRDRQNYSSSQKLKNTQSTPQLFVTPLSVQFQLSF